jgi:hypothetical protein
MRTRDYMTGFLFSLTSVLAWCGDAAQPAQWTSATTKELIRVVRLQPPDGPDRAARVGEPVRGKDLLKTGSLGSMADIQFDDNQTVARLGSDTHFTFNPGTGELSVPNGLTLLTVRDGTVSCVGCALKGKISSTAIVESFTVTNRPGTLGRCATKFILLEGKGVVSTRDGKQTKTLRGGQMILQYADDLKLADIQEVDLKRLIAESRIVNGFKQPLPSLAKIQQVVAQQQRDLWGGTLERTRFTIGGRRADRYQEPAPGRIDLEAPFDPDVPGGIVTGFTGPCPTCP